MGTDYETEASWSQNADELPEREYGGEPEETLTARLDHCRESARLDGKQQSLAKFHKVFAEIHFRHDHETCCIAV